MKYTITAILFCLPFVQCKAQSVNPGLKDAEDALKNGSPVSLVLTNPSFMDLHPQDEFRQLIKKYADSLPVDISPAGEPGRRIRAIVNVKNANGEPVKNCLVYFYQTDAKGWYSANSPHVGGNSGDMGHARLFGYGRTNSQGQLIVETVKPSGYPQSDLPAHIHIHFERPGSQEHITELLFDDDPRLVGRIRQQSVGFHISKPEPGPGGFEQQFTYNIELK